MGGMGPARQAPPTAPARIPGGSRARAGARGRGSAGESAPSAALVLPGAATDPRLLPLESQEPGARSQEERAGLNESCGQVRDSRSGDTLAAAGGSVCSQRSRRGTRRVGRHLRRSSSSIPATIRSSALSCPFIHTRNRARGRRLAPYSRIRSRISRLAMVFSGAFQFGLPWSTSWKESASMA